MSFVDHGGLGKAFPAHSQKTVESVDDTWDVNRLRSELQKRKVWAASLPGNVECWHAQLFPHVNAGTITFEAFVCEFAAQTKFDFSVALNNILCPRRQHAGGWYNSELAD